MSKYSSLIAKFKNKRICVIGDVILDQHITGNVSRISPEAPVPVVLQHGEPSFSPGGAANVASNLRSLGARAVLVGRIGPDLEGKEFISGLKKRRISTKGIVIDRTTSTILKTRIIAQHQQVLRLDREKTEHPSGEKVLKKVTRFLEKNIHLYDAIIISDYGKGMITKPLLEFICSLAKKEGKILTVDPKVEHFAYYRGVTAITPNKKEAENAIRNIKVTQNDRRRLSLDSDRLNTYADVERAAKKLLQFLDLESLMITLGEDGVCLIEKGKQPVRIHTKAQDVYDVTGAGDTVIATFTLGLTAGATKLQAADLANYAAGIVVGKMGAVTIRREDLLEVTK